MSTDYLDGLCECGRAWGEHTLREAREHGELDLPFTELDETDAVAQATAAKLQERFGLDPSLLPADHFVAKAGFLSLDGGPGRVPIVMLTFQIGVIGGPPVNMAEVIFMAQDAEHMRKFGKAVRDTANGAANAVAGV